MQSNRVNILLVDGNHSHRSSLCTSLISGGYSVDEKETYEEALDRIQSGYSIDLIIWAPSSGSEILPFMGGLRPDYNTPVLVIARDLNLNDRLTAYAAGVDDCIESTLPREEFLAKTASILRRFLEYRGKIITTSTLQINPEARTVSKDGQVIELTDLELNILEFLYEQDGNVVSIPEIYENVWGEKYFPGSNNAVMVHILNLRKKLEENMSHPKIIRTVWGKGYRLCL